MRFLVLADISDLAWHGGEGSADAVLACGDVDDAVILAAASAYHCPRVFAVKGNHDRNAPFAPPIIDCHLRGHALELLTVGGFNGSWRYKPRGHFLYEQDEAGLLLASMPAVDIFLAHSSPRGVHDRDDDVHVGFDAFSDYIQRARPRLFLHGHQHRTVETTLGVTRVIGVDGHRVIEL